MFLKRSAMTVVAGAVLAGLAGCQATGRSCTETCAKEDSHEVRRSTNQ